MDNLDEKIAEVYNADRCDWCHKKSTAVSLDGGAHAYCRRCLEAAVELLPERID